MKVTTPPRISERTVEPRVEISKKRSTRFISDEPKARSARFPGVSPMTGVAHAARAGSIPSRGMPVTPTADRAICPPVNIEMRKRNSRKEIGAEKSFDLNLG